MKDRPVVGIFVFLYIWLMVGFASGTGVLLGPARWVTTFARARGWTSGENVSMIVVIVLYVVASLFLARSLARRFSLGRRVARVAIPVGVTALAGVSFYGWSDPAMLARIAGGAVESRIGTVGGANFLFGAYPDFARLAELKREGINRVISLQSPEVVPIEPRGIAAEREAARRLGISFQNIPMLPWVSDNADALREIGSIADTATGRYYVHCGLGRDRANVVRAYLEHHGARVAAGGDLKAATTLASRTKPFERGMPIEIDRDVWVVPYPNRAEMFGHFLGDQFQTVVSVLDPTRPEQAPMIEEAKTLLPEYNVDVFFFPVRRESLQATAREAALLVRAVRRPVAVFVPGAAPHPWNDSTVAVAFRQAYLGLAGQGATGTGTMIAAKTTAGTTAGIGKTLADMPLRAVSAVARTRTHETRAVRARTTHEARAVRARTRTHETRVARARKAASGRPRAARRLAAVGATRSDVASARASTSGAHRKRSIFKRIFGHLHPVPLEGGAHR